jgi:dye decolorizing peroxidase/deferrochelatase/peroxidase EfeB
MPDQPIADPAPQSGEGIASRVSRRALIASIAASAGTAAAGGALAARVLGSEPNADSAPPAEAPGTEPFHGAHQPGIATAQQRHALFATFDLEEDDPSDGHRLTADEAAANFQELMERWTAVSERMMAGDPTGPVPANVPGAPDDSGVADGLAPSRLTLTFGLGPGLFELIGREDDRPRRLDPLPEFPGDLLEPDWSGGQLLVQICGDDPQVVSHAFRAVRARTPGIARLRWTQQGFLGSFGDSTPRNLFGHRDGTANPRPETPEFEESVRVDGEEEPDWFSGGSYLVFRKIRMDLPRWDTSTAEEQDRSIGRRRTDGAPLSGGDEFTAPDLAATGSDGEPLVPPDSHVALVRGVPMLRRSYNYDYGFQGRGLRPGAQEEHDDHAHDHDGAGHASYDSGVLFCAYLRDPGEFIDAQRALAASDRLNAFIRHTGSAIFAVPPGARPDRPLAAALFPRA